jgi:hypothetical protein
MDREHHRSIAMTWFNEDAGTPPPRIAGTAAAAWSVPEIPVKQPKRGR